MVSVPQSALDEMISRLPNKDQQQVRDLAFGKVAKRVRCMKCKRVIANIFTNERVQETPPLKDKNGKYGLYSSGLEGHRPRLDGETGFKCYCGNDSILAKAEQGHIGSTPPSRSDLEAIYEKLQRSKAKAKETKQGREVDGFVIEEVS